MKELKEPPNLEGVIDLSNAVDTEVTSKTLPGTLYYPFLYMFVHAQHVSSLVRISPAFLVLYFRAFCKINTLLKLCPSIPITKMYQFMILNYCHPFSLVLAIMPMVLGTMNFNLAFNLSLTRGSFRWMLIHISR